MSLRDITGRDAVLQATAEFDQLGREEFLRKYGFGPSKSYFVQHDGKFYDSKALLGAAHGFQFPGKGPLRPGDFSGGAATVMVKLKQLGFDVGFGDSVDRLSHVPRAFWVSQGTSYRKERANGYIWAPWEDKGGQAPVHWSRVAELRPGDVLVHYAEKSVRSVSRVIAAPIEAEQNQEPAEAASHWTGLGWKVAVEYHDLQPPILLEKVRKQVQDLELEQGPLTEAGGGKQGYLWNFSAEGLAIVRNAYAGTDWPAWAVLSPAGKQSRSAQALDEVYPSQIVEAFSHALADAHISFGSRHEAFVRAFVASLATKRFVILTGLSGSGKTQIALKFGEWLGTNRYTIIPVRPDWTGAEHLFGFEDALQKTVMGARAWQVPDALAFMLRAAADPGNPYLLVLDEMNLAHVERYFADFLSGMESGAPCLPNLKLNEHGLWTATSNEPSKISLPSNLFVVGTVNVDETTYMFSPKVLDRANTLEFRVTADALVTGAQRPVRIEGGSRELVEGFLTLALDDSWQLNQPAEELELLANALRHLHGVLAE